MRHYNILTLSLFFAIPRSTSFCTNILHPFVDTPTTQSKQRRILSFAFKSSQDDEVFVEQPFLPLQVEGVTLKMAFDRSYAVADKSEKKSERFTCPLSLDLVHKLRRCSDAVLVGRGTVETDNCTLTVRRVPLWGGTEQPWRVVLDPKLKILEKRDIKSDENDFALLSDEYRTIIYHSLSVEDQKLSLLQNDNKKVNLISTANPTHNSVSQSMSARKILEDLQSKGIQHVMVEGGPATALTFLKEKVVDRAILIRAPLDFIDPVPSGISDATMKGAGLEVIRERTIGDDTVEFWSKKGIPWPTGNGIEPWEWPC